jgi:hypothetical protein
MIFVVLALLATPLATVAPVCGMAQYDLASNGSAAEPAAAEPHDVMTFTPGSLFRTATRRWFGPAADADRIAKVTVRDEDFQVVRVLDSERELAAFRKLWAALVEADSRPWTPPPDRPYYKLNIQLIGFGGRTENASWFYFPGGCVKLLAVVRAIWIAPLYRMPSPGAFEELLRGDPSSPD